MRMPTAQSARIAPAIAQTLLPPLVSTIAELSSPFEDASLAERAGSAGSEPVPVRVNPLLDPDPYPKLRRLGHRARYQDGRTSVSLLKRFLGIDVEDDRSESAALDKIIAALDGMPPERAHYLAAFAYVLGRVAHADLRIEDSEVDAMVRATTSLGSLTESESKLVVEITLSQARDEGGTSNYLITREFRKISTREQRLGLIECLYAISAADGTISTTESAEVLKIAEELGLSRNETNAVKAGWKSHLAEFQGLPKS
jgi:uncharacterized tellurite resistance protein B-like protein